MKIGPILFKIQPFYWANITFRRLNSCWAGCDSFVQAKSMGMAPKKVNTRYTLEWPSWLFLILCLEFEQMMFRQLFRICFLKLYGRKTVSLGISLLTFLPYLFYIWKKEKQRQKWPLTIILNFSSVLFDLTPASSNIVASTL